MVVFDAVYNPENTLLVKEARGRNCTVVTGVDMFVRQACRQFELFTGQAGPAESCARRSAGPSAPQNTDVAHLRWHIAPGVISNRGLDVWASGFTVKCPRSYSLRQSSPQSYC